MVNRFALLFLVCAVAVSGAGAGGEHEVPNPLADSQVGDWVSYAISDDGRQEQKMTVIRRDGDGDGLKVVVKYDTYVNGMLTNSGTTTHSGADFAGQLPVQPGEGVEVEIDARDIEVKGEAIPCIVVKVTKNEGGGKPPVVREWFLSDMIPVYGVVRQSENGKSTSRLLDYGYGGVEDAEETQAAGDADEA